MPVQQVWKLALTAVVPAVAMASVASAEDPISRSNWVPNVGAFGEHEQPLGDMWTFRCPHGANVSISVDTKDDTDTGRSDIDPVLLLIDGAGNLLEFADDKVDCTYEPVCGWSCPEVTHVRCGQGERHSIVVRDFGESVASDIAPPCQEGGGYELTVEVSQGSGPFALGGGPHREVPDFALREGKAPVGPVLDDEDVPERGEEIFK